MKPFFVSTASDLRFWVGPWLRKNLFGECLKKYLGFMDRIIIKILDTKGCPAYKSDWAIFLENVPMWDIIDYIEKADQKPSTGYTDEEKSVIECLVQAWNNFVGLPVQHGEETAEFRHHIHALEGLMALRLARKIHPEMYTKKP